MVGIGHDYFPRVGIKRIDALLAEKAAENVGGKPLPETHHESAALVGKLPEKTDSVQHIGQLGQFCLKIALYIDGRRSVEQVLYQVPVKLFDLDQKTFVAAVALACDQCRFKEEIGYFPDGRNYHDDRCLAYGFPDDAQDVADPVPVLDRRTAEF